jgi:hypothetical protein
MTTNVYLAGALQASEAYGSYSYHDVLEQMCDGAFATPSNAYAYRRLLELHDGSDQYELVASIVPAISAHRLNTIRRHWGTDARNPMLVLLGDLHHHVAIEHLQCLTRSVQQFLLMQEQRPPTKDWPYAPQGLWHPLPPLGPLDYSVRARCSIPKVRTEPLEELTGTLMCVLGRYVCRQTSAHVPSDKELFQYWQAKVSPHGENFR